MKESQARTKVVLRHLPPSLTSSVLHEQILSKYAGTINWFAFHPGKSR
jgi:regulator of nonsense transcripts 3